MKPIKTIGRQFLLLYALLLLMWQVDAQVVIVPISPNPGTCISGTSTTPVGYSATNLAGTSNYVWSVKGDLVIDYTAAGGTEVYLHSQSTDPTRPGYGKGRLCVTYYDTIRSSICGDPIVCYDIYKIFADSTNNIVGPICISEGDTVTYSINALVSVNLGAEIGIDQYFWDATPGLIDEILYYSGDSSSITFVAGPLSGADTLFVDMGICNVGDGYRYALPIGQAIDSLSFVAGNGPECLSFSVTSYTFEIVPQTGVSYAWEIVGSWSYVGPNTGPTFTVLPDQSEAFIRITASNDCADRVFTYRINRTLDSTNFIIGDTCLTAGITAQFSINGIGSGVQITWGVAGTGWSVPPGQQGSTASIVVGTSTGTVTATAANCDSVVASLVVEIKPNAPTPIYGDTCIPYGVTDTLQYTIDPVANASGYVWFVPNGWTPVNLPSGTTLDVIPNGTTPGQIGVAAIGCDTSAVTYINVAYGSQKPDTILASETCLNAGMLDSIIFSVGTPITGEIYEWDIPADFGNILNYQSTTDSSQVQVQTLGNGGTYVIRVRATTQCGVSDWDTLIYTLDSLNFSINVQTLAPGAFYFASVIPPLGTAADFYTWTIDGIGYPGYSGPSTSGVAINVASLPGSAPYGLCVDVRATGGCITRVCQQWTPASMMRIPGKEFKPSLLLPDDRVVLFPNPTKEELNIEFTSSGNYEFSLIDINGKIVLEGKTAERKHLLNMSTLSNGTYYLYIKSDEGQTIKPVVVAH